jgi:hypothetical protein
LASALRGSLPNFSRLAALAELKPRLKVISRVSVIAKKRFIKTPPFKVKTLKKNAAIR